MRRGRTYTRLWTDNDDDYYITRLTFALTVTYAVAGSNNEYLYPLPADFFKLRYLDFRTAAADFLPMKKFNLGMKDDSPATPTTVSRGKTSGSPAALFPLGPDYPHGLLPDAGHDHGPAVPVRLRTSLTPRRSSPR